MTSSMSKAVRSWLDMRNDARAPFLVHPRGLLVERRQNGYDTADRSRVRRILCQVTYLTPPKQVVRVVRHDAVLLHCWRVQWDKVVGKSLRRETLPGLVCDAS